MYPIGFLCVMVLSINLSLQKTKGLSGKKLLIITTETPTFVITIRNSTGAVIDARGMGVEVMNWLSRFLDFEFSYSNNFAKHYENSSSGRGAKSYLLNGEVDMVLAPIILTAERSKVVDFPFPWNLGSYNMIIPSPEVLTNIGAPWKPFSVEVWLLLLASFIIITILLKLTSQFNRTGNDLNSYFGNYQRTFDYIITVFFGQGGVCYPTLIRIRLIVAVWCLAAFVLTNSYSTILISYVTSPDWKPLVNSISDIPKIPRLRIVVDEKMGADNILSEANSGIFREFGDMLRHDPSLRCPKPEQCLDKVKLGSYVYIQVANIEKYHINNDLMKTGKCSLMMGKEGFLFYYASYGLPKKSPLTDVFNFGIIRLHETGLIQLWESKFVPNSGKCLRVNAKPKKPRLSLNHLISAFVILLIGYGLSIIVFLFEQWRRLAGRFRGSLTR